MKVNEYIFITIAKQAIKIWIQIFVLFFKKSLEK